MTSTSLRSAARLICASALLVALSSPALAQTSGGFSPLPMPILNLLSYVVLLGFAVIAVVWWRKGRRPANLTLDPAAVDEGFTITPSTDGKSIEYSITGSGIGIGAWVGFVLGGLFFGTLFTMILAVSYKLNDAASLRNFLLMMGIALGAAFLWDRVRKQKFVFKITEGGVHAPDGQHYAKADISEILIRNQGSTAHSAPPQSTTVVVGTGVTGMAMMGASAMSNVSAGFGNAIGQSVAQSLAKRGNEVCIRHGRKVIPLAKYLREDDAIALFNTVREQL